MKLRKVAVYTVGYPVPFETILYSSRPFKNGTAFTEIYEVEFPNGDSYLVSVATSHPDVLAMHGAPDYKGISITNAHEHFASFLHLVLENEGKIVAPGEIIFIEFYPDRGDFPKLSQSYDFCFPQVKETVAKGDHIYWVYKTPPRWFHLWRADKPGRSVNHERVLLTEMPRALIRLAQKGYGREIHPILETAKDCWL